MWASVKDLSAYNLKSLRWSLLLTALLRYRSGTHSTTISRQRSFVIGHRSIFENVCFHFRFLLFPSVQEKSTICGHFVNSFALVFKSSAAVHHLAPGFPISSASLTHSNSAVLGDSWRLQSFVCSGEQLWAGGPLLLEPAAGGELLHYPLCRTQRLCRAEQGLPSPAGVHDSGFGVHL